MGSQVRVLLRPPEKPSNRKVRGFSYSIKWRKDAIPHGPIHSPGQAGQESPPGVGCPKPQDLALSPGAKNSGKQKALRPQEKRPCLEKGFRHGRCFCCDRISPSRRAVYRFPLCLRLPSASSDRHPRLASMSSVHRPVWLWSPVWGGTVGSRTRRVNTALRAVP